MSDEHLISSDVEPAVERKIELWQARLLDLSRRNRLLYYKPTQSSTAEILHPSPLDLFDRLVVRGRTLAFSIPEEEALDPSPDPEPGAFLPSPETGDLPHEPQFGEPGRPELEAQSNEQTPPDLAIEADMGASDAGAADASAADAGASNAGAQDASEEPSLQNLEQIEAMPSPDFLLPAAQPGPSLPDLQPTEPPPLLEPGASPPKPDSGDSPRRGAEDGNGLKPSGSRRRAPGALEIVTDHPARQLNRVLYNLRSRARTAREEQGVNILYLAFGLLHWRDAQVGDLVQAPLVLVPVDLRREGPGQPYHLSMLEEDILLNPTLQEMLRQSYKLELPSLPEDLDAAGLAAYWEAVSQAVSRQAQWVVEPRVVLSLFSYQKQMIVDDLQQNRPLLKAHPLIRLMSAPGEALPIPQGELIPAEALDERVPPSATFQVLDADSSQQEAIQAAKAGMSFVLQGPPGTGKSQTIANIIAEFLGEGKRVLFISAKMAALEVVQHRLNQAGLGDFCLQIHSYRRDKREVVEELGRSLDAAPAASPPQVEEKLRQLAITRQQLNAYVQALHAPRFGLGGLGGLGLSAFQAYGELARLSGAPKLTFRLEGLPELTPAGQQAQLSLVRQMATYPQVIEVYDRHPWRGCSLTELSFSLQNEIEAALNGLERDLNALRSETAALASRYGVRPPASLQEAWDLLRTAQAYQPGILGAPLAEIRSRYARHYQSGLRYLRPDYWQDSALLRSFSRTGQRPDPYKCLEELEVALRVQARRSGEAPPTSPPGPDGLEELITRAERIRQASSFLAGQFASGQLPQGLAGLWSAPFDQALAWCRQQAGEMDSLPDWTAFNRLRRQAEDSGLGGFVSQALEAGLPAARWPEAYQRQFYTLLADAIARQDPALSHFQGAAHQGLVEQFRQLDREQIALAQQQIRARLSQRRPQASWMSSASTEEAILRRELNKKRRLKPLRRLFAEIPGLILALRPCLMMSPLTVSQLLDPELFHFDLVIFDEASQIHPEESVGAIARGRQAIIVGDRHQLPPTSFFEILESDDGYEEAAQDVEDFESILNEGDAAGLPSKMLLWHYRSRNEALIAFSNYHFYANRLLTFPSAASTVDRNSGNGSKTGIEFIYVPEGVYQRGRGGRSNPAEARRVVALILDQVRQHPEQSLGVVTFSQAQRDAIQMELERVLKEDPTLQVYFQDSAAEPFFVKNLELVQGDERDVMIFSVGYGRDEAGRFSLNFGPLNRDGGERRLNVAVTRARQRVRLVASIQPEDIDLSRTDSRGVRLLRSYMTLARDGLKALYADLALDPQAEFESPFEASVYQALSERGLRLHHQVGVSSYRIDLAVVDPDQPGRYLLGIECDGAMYHAAATARDRDRLRQQVLETLGWRIHRIWSRDWVENRRREVEKVLRAVEEARQAIIQANIQTITQAIIADSRTTGEEDPPAHASGSGGAPDPGEARIVLDPAVEDSQPEPLGGPRETHQDHPEPRDGHPEPFARHPERASSAGASEGSPLSPSRDSSPGTGGPKPPGRRAQNDTIAEERPSLPPGVRPYYTARLRGVRPGLENLLREPVSSLQHAVRVVVEAEGPVAVSLVKKRLAEAWGLPRQTPRSSQALDRAIESAVRHGLVRQQGDFLWPQVMSVVPVRAPQDGRPLRLIEEIAPEEIGQALHLCVQSALSIAPVDLVRQAARLFGLRPGTKVNAAIEAVLQSMIQEGRLELRAGKVRLPHS